MEEIFKVLLIAVLKFFCAIGYISEELALDCSIKTNIFSEYNRKFYAKSHNY
jgi:hypothetical protein